MNVYGRYALAAAAEKVASLLARSKALCARCSQKMAGAVIASGRWSVRIARSAGGQSAAATKGALVIAGKGVQRANGLLPLATLLCLALVGLRLELLPTMVTVRFHVVKPYL